MIEIFLPLIIGLVLVGLVIQYSIVACSFFNEYNGLNTKKELFLALIPFNWGCGKLIKFTIKRYKDLD